MNVDPSFIWGLVTSAVVSTAYIHIFVTNHVKQTKKETCEEIDKRISTLERNLKELEDDYDKFLMEYSEEIAKRRESNAKAKQEREQLWRYIFDLTEDVKDIFKKDKLIKREREVKRYEEFRRNILQLSFDTLDSNDDN